MSCEGLGLRGLENMAMLAREEDDFLSNTLKNLYRQIHVAADIQLHNVDVIQARQASIERGMRDESIANTLSEIVERCKFIHSVTIHVELLLARKVEACFGRDCLLKLKSGAEDAVEDAVKAAELDFTTKKRIALPIKSSCGFGTSTELHGNGGSVLHNAQSDGCSHDDVRVANGSDNAGGFKEVDSVKVGESYLMPKSLFSTQQDSAGQKDSTFNEIAAKGIADPGRDVDGSEIMSRTSSTPSDGATSPNFDGSGDADSDADHSDPKSPTNSLDSSDERTPADYANSDDEDSTHGKGSGTKPSTRSGTQNANGVKRKRIVYDNEPSDRSLGMAKKHRPKKKALNASEQARINNSVASAPPSDDGFFMNERQKERQEEYY